MKFVSWFRSRFLVEILGHCEESIPISDSGLLFSLRIMSGVLSRFIPSAITNVFGGKTDHSQSLTKEICIKRLRIHPIKSCSGQDVDRADYDKSECFPSFLLTSGHDVLLLFADGLIYDRT